MWLFLANQIALLTLLKNWVYWHWSWNQNMSIHSGIMVVVVFSDEQAYFDMAYIILDISKLFRPKCGFYLLYLDSSQQIDCKYLNFFLWMILSRKKIWVWYCTRLFPNQSPNNWSQPFTYLDKQTLDHRKNQKSWGIMSAATSHIIISNVVFHLSHNFFEQLI